MTNRDDPIAPDVRAVLDGISRLPVHEPPPDIWRGIERELDRAQVAVRDPHRRRITSIKSIAGRNCLAVSRWLTIVLKSASDVPVLCSMNPGSSIRF